VTLGVEAHIAPIDFYLDSRLAAFQERLANTKVGQFIENACSTIQARIGNRRGRKTTRKITIGEQRKEWAGKWANWTQQGLSTRQATLEKQRVLETWKIRWYAQGAQRQTQWYWDQIKRPLDPTILQLHKYLRKAESAMLVQL
jgi:hypothetical protein